MLGIRKCDFGAPQWFSQKDTVAGISSQGDTI